MLLWLYLKNTVHCVYSTSTYVQYIYVCVKDEMSFIPGIYSLYMLLNSHGPAMRGGMVLGLPIAGGELPILWSYFPHFWGRF